MVFSSLFFLYIFLPLCLLLYFIQRSLTAKNIVLVCASLVFYAWGEPVYVLLMLAVSALNWGFSLAFEKKRSRALLARCVALNLSGLIVFKYAGFLVENCNAIFKTAFAVPQISLPIGISFYTFQALSYSVDVYRKDVAAQRSYWKLLLYVSMFPQLIAGPIVRYAEIAPQLDSRQTTLEDVSSGACRFVIGLSKKVLLANVLYELITAFQQSRDLSVLYFWLYAVSFTLQLYFDFSGYSDMAIGLGRIFGFRFQENFNYPYISGSITEFWRRWHISLGSWFRDYVYIPLGGNRVSKAKWLRNILVVWMLTGLWHGASWNFVLWGLGFAILLVAEKLVYGRLLQRTHVLKHVYTLLLVTLSFVLFNADSVSEAVSQLGAMFGAGGLPLVSTEGVYYLKSYAGTFLFAAIGATPLVSNAISRFGKTRFGAQALTVLQPLVMLALLAACTAFLVDGSFNPFLYFRF